MHAGQREAQRPRQRRPLLASPYVFRNAGKLLVRRLLQAGSDPVRLEAPDRGVALAAGAVAPHGVQGRVRDSAGRRGVRGLERARPGRPHHRARAGGQLLGNGRHRALRPLLGGALPPRRRDPVRRAGLPRPRLQLRPLHRDLEQRVHGVRPGHRREPDPVTGRLDRHRDGTRADRRGHPGQGLELRHRPVRAPAARAR